MNGRTLMVATLALTALLAAGCMHKMMMSDRSMMTSGGMMMTNADGTSRPMTDAEMRDHLSMMASDPRFAPMMAERCKSMSMTSNTGSMSSTSSMPMTMPMSGSSSNGTMMMVMNSNGTSRAMTDAEMRSQVNMMAKNAQMSPMLMSKCPGM